MILIADYGVGNLMSVERMLRKAGANVKLSSNPNEIAEASKIVLPGVGNYGECVRRLRQAPFFNVLNEVVLQEKRLVLGICVGAQMLGNSSEEAPEATGLGWIDMICKRFPERAGFRIPNMGWNTISISRASQLLAGSTAQSRYYFVHSYHFECNDPADVVATANYGFDYPCVVARGNIMGVQFHPEKSLRHGMAVLKAFSEM